MAEAPNTQQTTTPAVTFEDAPGEHGFDRMFPKEAGDEQPPAAPGADEQPPDDVSAPGADEQPPAFTPDPALIARLSQIEAQNAQLTQQLSGLLSQRSQETLAAQITRLEDAVAAGDVAAAEEARKAIETFKTQAIAAPATPPPQNGGYQSSAPAGHWSHSLTGEAQTWMASQNWWGTDGARTAAVRQMANHMAPEKFATKEAYFQALLTSADQSIGRGAPANTPTPRAGSQGAQRGAAGSAGRGGDVTSIKQLQGAERTAAEEAMRYGNLTEQAYLASYNAVRKTQAARNRGR